MEKAVVVHWKDHYKNVCGKLYELFLQEKLTDVTVRCGDSSTKCHSAILTGNSSYLEEILSGGCNEVVFPDMAKETLEKFFEFLYMGATILEESELNSFLEAGRLLRITGLVDIDRKCEDESDHNEVIINSKEDFRSLLQKVGAAAENTSEAVLNQAQIAINKVTHGSQLAIETLRRCVMMDERSEDCEAKDNMMTEDNIAAQQLSEQLKKDDWAAEPNSINACVDLTRMSKNQNEAQYIVVDEDDTQYWLENIRSNDCYLANTDQVDNDNLRYICTDNTRDVGSDESTQEASETEGQLSDAEIDY